MGTYNIHAGHAPANSGGASGAVGILNESNEARKVKNRVIELLRAQGDTVYDCTCDKSLSQDAVLHYIVTQCNAHPVDLDISIHLNAGKNDYAGDGSTGGCEALIYDAKTDDIASRINTNIAKALCIRNRGLKDGSGLYVIRNTKSAALLVECAFVDDRDDTDRWNSDACAKAIVEGVLNMSINQTPIIKHTNVGIYGANYSDAQKWKIVKDFPGDFYQIFSKCNMNYLNVEGAQGIKGSNVTVAPGNRKPEQNWLVKEIKQDTGIGATSVYEILPALNGNLRLTVDGPYAKDGTNVNIQEVHTDYRQDGQRFYIRQVADGYVNIINVATGKLLDVYNAGK